MHTLYAKWTANTYTVAYNANKPSGASNNVAGSTTTSTHIYNTAKNLTSNGFSLTGWTFMGWSTNSAATTATYTNGKSVSNLTATANGTVNLYAVWTANTYGVTLNMQSGSGGSGSVTATSDSAMPGITVPTRTGYTFGGYYTSANGGGTQYYTAAGASTRNWNKTSATTLYAK